MTSHTHHHRFHHLLRSVVIAAQLVFVASAGALSGGARFAAAAPSQITGTVFEDFNSNGVQDTTAILNNNGSGTIGVAVDRGIPGVTVTAYDAAGNAVGTANTAPDGSYAINIPAIAGPYRVEFTNLPAGYTPSFHGSSNSTSVQFVADGNTGNVNFAVVSAANYCQDNPTLVTNCYRFGDQVNGENSETSALASFPYSAGSNSDVNIPPYDTPVPVNVVRARQVGTTWGLAYARTTKRLYAAAFFKKHAGFGPGQDGVINTADDPGAVYVINPATNAVVSTFTVPGATTNAHNTGNYLFDNLNVGWDAVGKTSLGGIALSPDESRLYVMNLENRMLYALNADTGAVLASAAVPTSNVPTPGGTAATCAPGDVRPFAVEVYRGVGYVGTVCSAESTQNLLNLRAYVYTFDLNTLAFSAAPAFQFPLNYSRQFANTGPSQSALWNAWQPAFTALPTNVDDLNYLFPVFPQPVLSSIAFDVDGNMVLGIRDRFGDQMGVETPSNPADPEALYYGVSAGDTLRACGNPTSGWTLEDNARCGGLGSQPQGNNEGPGGGEYYHRDEYNPFHREVSLGAVLQVPGFPDVVATTYNPIPINGSTETTFDSGARWFNNTTGGYGKGYRIYNGDLAGGNLFGKAAGLGDLVALCNEAPIELGNRVWNDVNGNGRQDPGEPDLNGVVVGLYDGAGNLLLTTTTTVSGTYYFTATNAAGTALIQPNTAYRIGIDVNQPALAGLNPTIPNFSGITSNDAILDVNDSDGLLSAGLAVVSFTTGGAGATNHGFDFGFTAAPQVQFDWGDNPDTGVGTGPGNYNTLLNDDGPRHQIIPGLLIGTVIDAETNGQPSVAANGDDTNPPGAPDDEDGVNVADLTLTQGAAANVRVNATNTTGQVATLCGFIDFNGDGDFLDAGESTSVVVPTGSSNQQFTLSFGTVPGGAAAAAYARFRLANGTAACVATGLANSGEVEDYPVVIGQPGLISLGNQVWFDTNNNGAIDFGVEAGVPGVTMQLYQDTNADCIYSPGDTLLGTTATGAGGYYTFTNLSPSTGPSTAYIVVIPATNFAPGGPLNNYQNSTPNVGCDVQDRDDFNHGVVVNGRLGAGGFISSRAMTLTATNLSYDFGFYRLTLGDLVWADNNDNGVRDAGEPGLPNIPVRLTDCVASTPLDTTTTDASGIYTFTNLISGTYCVQIVVTTGRSSTDITSTANPNNNVNSDDNGVGAGNLVVASNAVALTPGSPGALNNNIVNNATGSTTNPTLDFGIFLECPPGPLVVTVESTPPASAAVVLNSVIAYTLRVTNTDVVPAVNVNVFSGIPADTLQFLSANPAPNDPAPNLRWNVGMLNGGGTTKIEFTARVISLPTTGRFNFDVSVSGTTPEGVAFCPLISNVDSPTSVTLAAFTASLEASGGAKIEWRTTTEKNAFGFYVLRSLTGQRDDAQPVNVEIIPARGVNGGGATYSLIDPQGSLNARYWLKEIEVSGAELFYGPVQAQASTVGNGQGQQQTQPAGIVIPAGVVLGGVPIPSLNPSASDMLPQAPQSAPQAQTALPQSQAQANPAVIPAQSQAASVPQQAQPVAADPAPLRPEPAPVVESATAGDKASSASVVQHGPASGPASAAAPAAEPVEGEMEAVGAVNAVNVARGSRQAEPAVNIASVTQPALKTADRPEATGGALLVALVGLAGLAALTMGVLFRRRKS